MSSAVVIYHADCVDGFTSAWIASTVLDAGATYVPAKYGDAPPDVTGKTVLIVDFSYPRPVLIEMAAKARTVQVFDHHATAERDLAGLDFCTFDKKRSGAAIVWDRLRAGEPRPLLVELVMDRDLWSWKIANSKALNAWIGVKERTFEQWDELVRELDDEIERCIDRGSAILDHIAAYVDVTAKNARMMRVDGRSVPVVNAPGMMGSELIGHLADNADFAMGWFQRADGQYQYSLRSRGAGGVDVSKVAEKFGGGGHAGAAGFWANRSPDELFIEATGEKTS